MPFAGGLNSTSRPECSHSSKNKRIDSKGLISPIKDLQQTPAGAVPSKSLRSRRTSQKKISISPESRRVSFEDEEQSSSLVDCVAVAPIDGRRYSTRSGLTNYSNATSPTADPPPTPSSSTAEFSHGIISKVWRNSGFFVQKQ